MFVLGDYNSIRDWFNEYSADPVFLETLIMWTENPSSKSANFGGDDFWLAVRDNLQNRYDVPHVVRIVQQVRNFIERSIDVIEKDELNDQLETLLDEPYVISLEARLIDLLKNESQLRRHVSILAEYFIDNELWEYSLTGRDKRSINSRLGKKMKSKIYDFDDFIKIGFLYKLPWIKSSYDSVNETLYTFPAHSITVLAELYTDPDLEQPYTCRYCELTFRTDTELKEHEKQCSKNLNKVEKSESIEQSTGVFKALTEDMHMETDIFLIKRGEATRVGHALLENIIQNASEYINLEDNYINLAIIKHLLSNPKIKIRILTSLYNSSKRDLPDYVHIAKLLGEMEKISDKRLQIKETGGPWTHDRVLITETEGWALSTSMKDIVNNDKWSLLFRLPSEIIKYIHDDFEGLWSVSEKVTANTYSNVIRNLKKNGR